MSYTIGAIEDGTSFEPGTSLLLTGASTDTNDKLLDAVAPRDGERAVVITTNRSAPEIHAALTDRGASSEQVSIIDCTGADAGREDVTSRRLQSPGDLTGISLEFAKILEDVDDGVPVRVGFASISTALMYVELRTLFRFLHVFTARIRSGEMFGVFSMDPSMHDEKAHNTIRAVFDCEAQVANGEAELRGTGFHQ